MVHESKPPSKFEPLIDPKKTDEINWNLEIIKRAWPKQHEERLEKSPIVHRYIEAKGEHAYWDFITSSHYRPTRLGVPDESSYYGTYHDDEGNQHVVWKERLHKE